LESFFDDLKHFATAANEEEGSPTSVASQWAATQLEKKVDTVEIDIYKV